MIQKYATLFTLISNSNANYNWWLQIVLGKAISLGANDTAEIVVFPSQSYCPRNKSSWIRTPRK